MSKNTSIKLKEVIDSYVSFFCATDVFYNTELIWGDDSELSYEEARDKYFDTHKHSDQYLVGSVDVDIVHFHHAVLFIYDEKRAK